MDWSYIVLVLPAVLFSLWASVRVKQTFSKYSRERATCGMTGWDAARMILDNAGLYDVRIEATPGELTDHYDPKRNVVRLSENVISAQTVAAIGVAAHECGHAIQHATGYTPVKLRTAIVPITNIGSKLSTPLILLGLILSAYADKWLLLAYIGVACFSLCALFQLVTLPTEYNASSRAMELLQTGGRLSTTELKGARKVLSAAALTYVAALAVTLMQLIRLVLILGRYTNRRD